MLGFTDYVAALKKSGATHLFPEWYDDGMKALERAEIKFRVTGKKAILNHHFPKFLPKRFNQTCRDKVKITDKRKDFYAFRHTFKTGLAQEGVSKDIRDNLTGHADSSAGSVYVHDVSLAAMRDAIEEMKFDGIDL